MRCYSRSPRALTEMAEDANNPSAHWQQGETKPRYATRQQAIEAFTALLRLCDALPPMPPRRRLPQGDVFLL